MKIPQILTLILESAYIKKKNRISTILLFLVAEIRLERMTFGL